MSFKRTTSHKPAPSCLGNALLGKPRGQNPELNLIADTSAPLLPEASTPQQDAHDYSLQVFGKANDDKDSRVVHSSDCQCNVDPDTNSVEEIKENCTKLVVKRSQLKVTNCLSMCHFFFLVFVGCRRGAHWRWPVHNSAHQTRCPSAKPVRIRNLQIGSGVC